MEWKMSEVQTITTGIQPSPKSGPIARFCAGSLPGQTEHIPGPYLCPHSYNPTLPDLCGVASMTSCRYVSIAYVPSLK